MGAGAARQLRGRYGRGRRRDPGRGGRARARRIRRGPMKTTLHLQDADTFYEQLLDAHQGLSPEESQLLNARLILLLANQVGDAKVLKECIEAARESPK